MLRLSPCHAAIIAAFAGIPAFAQTAAPAVSEETLSTITVEASADASAEGLPPSYAGGQVARGSRAGLLGNLDTMEMPFNSTQYTNELIKNQQAASVADILQNDPGVTMARGYGNFQQTYKVRGFLLFSDDIAYNGLYGLLPRQYLASEFIERLEVFRGANAFLNGAAPGGLGSGIGGSVNVVPKRASNEPLSQVTLGWETGGQGYAAADLGRRFGPDNSTGIRVNAVRRSGGTGVDDEHRELSAGGIGLDWHNTRMRLSADIGWQDHQLDRSQPNVTVNAGVPIPRAPEASTNFAQPFTYSNERDLFGTARGEFDLSDNVTAWAAFGARESDETTLTANPNVINTNGDTSVPWAMRVKRKDSVRTGELGLRAKFNTGNVGHTVNASANYFTLDIRNAYAYGGSISSNLYNPVASPLPSLSTAAGSFTEPHLFERKRLTSYALSDTLSFNKDRVLLTLGARHQEIELRAYDINTNLQTGDTNKASRITPVAGVVFKASDAVSLYANYIEGLTQIGQAPALNSGSPVPNAGKTFKPVQSKQKEIGIKYDGGKLGGSLALFTIDQPLTGYDAANNYGLYGEQRNRGLELTAYGEPARGLRVLGGFTLLDAEQKNTPGGTNDGKDAIGVPKTQINAGIEWDVPNAHGLTLTGRAVHTSSQYADEKNTQEVPSWTRLDLGARYLTEVNGRLLTLRANVLNVTDKNYWASAGGYPGSGYLVLGAPRTFMLSASLDF